MKVKIIIGIVLIFGLVLIGLYVFKKEEADEEVKIPPGTFHSTPNPNLEGEAEPDPDNQPVS